MRDRTWTVPETVPVGVVRRIPKVHQRFGPVRTFLRLANARVNSSLNAERRKYRCRRCSLASARHRAQSLHPHGRAARPNPALVQVRLMQSGANWCAPLH